MLALLQDTARRTGSSAEVLTALATRESRLDPRARNSQSSARGLMQFTESTWLEAVRDHGAEHGLPREARAIATDPQTGELSVRDPRQRKRILDLRFNPRLAAAMAGERTALAQAALAEALGRAPSAADLYAVHMLGPAGARRFLAALAERPASRAADAASTDAVARNRNVFFARDGRARTVAEVHAAMARDAAEAAARLPRPARTEVAEASR
jgi:hypothetical protein